MEIEQLVTKALTESTGVPAFLEEPASPRPGSYYLAARIGSSEENHLSRARLAVQSYAESLLETLSLDRAARDVIKGLVSCPAVVRAALVSDYDFTDTQTHRYRHQAVYELIYYDDILQGVI